MKALFRIQAIVTKELIQLRRDKMTFGMIVMIPLIQLMLFGYAINTNIRHIPVGVVDHSRTGLSRVLMQTISATQVVKFTGHYQNQQQAVDGSDNIIAAAIKSLRNMPLAELLSKPVNRNTPTFEVTLYYNPEQRTAVNIVPGLVGIILTMTMIMFTSAAIVRERERGNLEMLITTPVRSIELMIGKIIPYMFIGAIQVTIILGLGYLVFNVPINGSLLQLAGVTFYEINPRCSIA